MKISFQEEKAFLSEEKLRRLQPEEVNPYITRLVSRLGQLSQIMTRDGDEFVAPYISVIQETLNCLLLKHSISVRNQMDFSLTIDPQDSGFPSFKDFYLLGKDRAIAEASLANFPSREKIIDCIRDAILRGDSPANPQDSLVKFDYFTNLTNANLLRDYYLSEPIVGGEEDGRRDYVLQWSCFERVSNLPVFYRLWLSQDSGDKPLDERFKPGLENIIYTTVAGLNDLRTVISCMDQAIESIHPKLIYKYVIGPYYDCLTENSPEIKKLFEGVEDPSMLKLRVQRVASVGTRRRSSQTWKKWLGIDVEKEYYGEVDDYDSRMIVPVRIRQKLPRDRDEYNRECKVYGVTDGGDISL